MRVTKTRKLTSAPSLLAGLKFADPGKERQDSVFNGLQTIPDNAALVCVHDAARPLVSREEVYKVNNAAQGWSNEFLFFCLLHALELRQWLRRALTPHARTV